MRLFPAVTALAVIFALACPSHAETNVEHTITLPAAPAHAAGTGTVTLHWTAPGDDSISGTAAVYDMHCSGYPMTALNFWKTQWVAHMPKPHAAGTQESLTVTGLMANQVYYFSVRSADEAGNWSAMSNIVSKVAVGPIGVSEDGVRITDLSRPWPNPARSTTKFSLSLATPGNVGIEVFDIMGRHVRTLAHGTFALGDRSVSWDLRDDHGDLVPSAVYKVRASLGTQEFVRSVVVVR
jgi:hypothetical protein